MKKPVHGESNDGTIQYYESLAEASVAVDLYHPFDAHRRIRTALSTGRLAYGMKWSYTHTKDSGVDAEAR